MASHQLDTILQHSQLNVKHTIASLINVIDQLLQEGFRPDQYETYNNHLSILRDFISYLSSKDQTRGKDKNVVQGDSDDVSIQSEAFQKVCLPMLNNLFPSQNSNPEILVVLGNTAKLTAACVVNNKALFSVVIEFIISNVETFIREGPSKFNLLEDRSTPDISTQLEVLRYVLSVTTSLGSLEKTDLDKLLVLFDKLTQTVSNISNEIIGTSCIPVLLKILNTGADYDRLLNKVWESAKQCHTEAERKEYLLLCGFANHFFPVNGQLRNTTTIDVRKDGMFWSMLQTGLYCKDSLTRKRSLYLIKRIVDICESNAVDFIGDDNKVFWWTKEKCLALSKVWEDFMLLAEVLEEKQVHVIKPLLPRMKNLVTASCLNKDNDTPLLHTSWLKTVLLRSSHHESLQIIRWSADTVLSLDLTKCPMIQQGLDKYLAGEMLYSLQEPKLYIKEAASPVGTFPVIADKLVQYFNTCCTALTPDERDSFFNLTLRNIAAKDWGPISLLFICRGLAMVPQCPCLDRETVLSLRRLLTGFLVTMDTYFRGAIQCYIVQILIKLTDKSKVPLEDFMQILSLVRREESLQRGTTLWGQCVTWLSEEPTDQSAWSSEGIRQYLEATVATYLQTTIDSKYSVGDSTTAGSVARLLLLASDASIATKEDDAGGTTLQRITDCLVGVLNSINTHSYMSVHKADKALLLLMSIVTESRTKGCESDDDVTRTIYTAVEHSGCESDDNLMRTIYTAVEHCSSEIAVYVCRQMFDAVTSLDDLGVMYLYMDSVEMITKTIGVKCCPYWTPLVDKCVNILSKPTENVGMTATLHQLASMCILGKLSSVLINVEDKRYTELIDNVCSLFKSWKVVSNFSKPVGVQSLSHQEWGRVTSLFQQQQWQVVMLALHQGSSACWFDIQELLTVAEDTLSVGLEQTTCIVLRCLKLIIPKVKDVVSEDRLVVILTTCWSCLQEARRLLAFWDVLESFVQAIFQPCLLEMDEESPVVIKLTEFAEEMIEIGTDKNGVVNALSTQLYHVLSQPDMIQHTGKYTSVIVNLCKFGGLVRRGVRQVYDICAALEHDGKACPVNELMKGIRNEDIGVRVAVSSLLCALNPDVPAHCNIATSVIKSCYQCYYDIAKSSTNKFANSQVHRQRHRLIQTVLLLQQFITDDYAEDIWSLLWSSLEFETQPSIRHMLEWLILWMMYKHDTFRPQLWNLFEKYRDSKNLTLCSLLCIVIHLGPHLPKHEQVEYYKKAMPYILPWCMAHHFQTRIYSQAVLAKLWDQCRLLGLDEVLKENAILQCIMDFTQENRNSTKNVKKLLDSFVFKYLDFERDFTIQTLFYVMPKMTALTGEDWIIPEFFIDLNPAWADDTASRIIRLRNHSSKFDNCDPGLWKYTGLKVPEDDEVADDTVTEEGEGDVQKKIMPWRQMMIEEDVVSEVDHGVKQLAEHGLVVVTSLINKIPNLGGLCRTSEIFGVSEYVMSKLGYTEDKAFQGLSVTAHKWLPLTEVPEVKLEDFLQQKRLEGYTLVGVEQTANSVSLSDYTFPEKTLLLLGNEKEGIPVELISHLDVCVEIPQQGVVRSLNVHVSGAILIWEYRRQQLMKPIT